MNYSDEKILIGTSGVFKTRTFNLITGPDEGNQILAKAECFYSVSSYSGDKLVPIVEIESVLNPQTGTYWRNNIFSDNPNFLPDPLYQYENEPRNSRFLVAANLEEKYSETINSEQHIVVQVAHRVIEEGLRPLILANSLESHIINESNANTWELIIADRSHY